MTIPDSLVGTPIDVLVAPLDELWRDAPSLVGVQHAQAYALAMLAAELISTDRMRRAAPGYLLEYLEAVGIEPGTAQTIARALGSAVVRVTGMIDGQ